jgi:hypothetical protein
MQIVKKLVLLATVGLSICAVEANAAPLNVLWLDGGDTSWETQELNLQSPYVSGDPSSATWNITFWNGSTSAPLAQSNYNVLVVGSDSSSNASLFTNYAPTLGNRIFVTGQDADYHYNDGPGPSNFNGPGGFLRDAINWAGAGTGLGVVVLSPGEGSVPLDTLGITGIGGDVGGSDEVDIPSAVASFPVNSGLTSTGLSNWGESAHDTWTSVSSAWTGINTNGTDGQYVTLVSADTAGGAAAGNSTPAVDVPEPVSLALLGTGFAALGLVKSRRKAAPAA